jgi:hypothetical protein
MQHWLKVMHNREGRDLDYWQGNTWISDAHWVRDGEPQGRPTYAVGDALVVYWAGTDRCPAILRVQTLPVFNPDRVSEEGLTDDDGARWGWLTEVEVVGAVPRADAPTLRDPEIGKASVRRRSRLRLTRDQYARAHARIIDRDVETWRLLPGDEIKRTELHARFGGSGQGGINPSAKTANVFIFTDPVRGHRHGYLEDGWHDDNCFHYTGEGQEGDQRITSETGRSRPIETRGADCVSSTGVPGPLSTSASSG